MQGMHLRDECATTEDMEAYFDDVEMEPQGCGCKARVEHEGDRCGDTAKYVRKLHEIPIKSA